MNPDDIIQSDKPIRVHCIWVCGDGCCADSATVEIPAGTYTTVEFCDQLDMIDHVVTSHYWDRLELANYQDRGWYDYEYREDDRTYEE